MQFFSSFASRQFDRGHLVQAKKVKASKGKKLQLLRDGYTPTETVPAEDADSASIVVEKQFESNNKVQAPKIVVNNQVIYSNLCSNHSLKSSIFCSHFFACSILVVMKIISACWYNT